MLKNLILILVLLGFWTVPCHAFWVWTPDSGKWTNPKYSVKDTPKAQLAFALDFYMSKDYKKATEELQKLLKYYPRAREAADAQFYLAVIQEDQGQWKAAFKSYQQVIDKYPFSERCAEVVKRQYEIGNALLEGKDKRNKFIDAVSGGEYDVVEIFRAVIKNAPYGELAAPSQYKIGLYLLGKQLYQEARDEFEKTRNDYPDSQWAQAAKFQIALADAKRSPKAQYDQKVTNSALKEFQDFVKKFPDADLSKDAKDHINALREKEAENFFLIAEFYKKQKKVDSAKFYYTTIINEYSDTKCAKDAGKALQLLELKMKKIFSLVVLLAVLVFPSCGYSPRSSLAANIKTVCVPPFLNKIDFRARNATGYVPLLEVKAHDAVVNQFLFDGNLRIAPEKTADLVLKGELIDYNRDALRFLDNDDIQQYRITVTVRLTMLDDKGQVLWEEPRFSGEATYFLNGTNATSESSAIDNANQDLAKRIVERTVEDW